MDSRSAMLSAAMFLIIGSGYFSSFIVRREADTGLSLGRWRAFDLDALQRGEIGRQFGLACRKLVELEHIRRNVAGLLRCHRPWCVGGHRRMHAIEEIGDGEVVPVAEKLEPDKGGARFPAGQLGAVTARAELVGHH